MCGVGWDVEKESEEDEENGEKLFRDDYKGGLLNDVG